MLGLLILFLFAAAIITLVVAGGTILRLRHPPRFTFAAALARGLPTEPREAGLAGRECILQLSDGSESPGWIVQGQSTDPRAPVVVLTHGWGESRYLSLIRAGQLAPAAAALVLYDLRAHGDARSPRADLGTTEVADLLAVVGQLDALGAAPGAPVVLAGHSIGAGISIAAAARANAAGTDLKSRSIRGVIGDGAYRLGMDPIHGYFRANRWPVYPFLWPVALYLHFFVQRGSDFDRAGHASRLACPLLLLHGERDTICAIASARAIAEAVPDTRSGSRLVLFPEGTHLDLAEVDPARYVEAVQSFLRGVASEAAPAATPTGDSA